MDARELQPNDTPSSPKFIDAVKSKQWEIAAYRFDCIQPLLTVRYRTRSSVARRAAELGVDTATLYRWLSTYEEDGKVSSLLPRPKKMPPRLLPAQEDVMAQAIESVRYTKGDPSVSFIWKEVKRLCELSNMPVPSYNTLRTRVHDQHLLQEVKKKRNGYKEALLYEPLKGSTPDGDSPRSMVEIDHALFDIELVDRENRKRTVGRPWVTLGIDLFSRMVTGYFVSFDRPGTAAVAMCIMHSVMPKHDFVKQHGTKLDWPFWGKMDAIKVDNAKEFTSEALTRACQEHGIRIVRRPARRPHFAGTVERIFGTLQSELRMLPGWTGSNPQRRGEVNPVSTAALTLPEFERWLARLIVDVYHNERHEGIGTTPLNKYEEGLFDDSQGRLPRGLPAPIDDPDKMLLDFLPSQSRTIQRYGVQLNGAEYYDDILGPYVNTTEPGTKRKRHFTFKVDPSDISKIYFFDPVLKRYFPIRSRDRAMGKWSASEWRRHRRSNRKLRQQASVPFASSLGRTAMKEVETAARSATRKSRRGQKPPRKLSPPAPYESPTVLANREPNRPKQHIVVGPILPFDELE